MGVLKVCTGGSHAWKRFTNKGAQVSHNNQKGNRAMKIQAGQHKKHHNMDFKKGQGCLDHHVIQHSAGYTKDIQVISNLMKAQQSSTCTDKCTKTTTKTSMHTGSCKGPKVAFNTLKPASYFVKYHCADTNGNSVTKCRTVVNEDHTKPVLDILGNDLMTIEATYHKNYVDDGATCSDQVDDVISQQVEVSGDVVNLSISAPTRSRTSARTPPATPPTLLPALWSSRTPPALPASSTVARRPRRSSARLPSLTPTSAPPAPTTSTAPVPPSAPAPSTSRPPARTSSLTPPPTSPATPSARASASTPPAAPSSSRTPSSPLSPSTSAARRSTSPRPATRVSTARPTMLSTPGTTLTSWKRPRPPLTDGLWAPSPLPSLASLSLATP